MQGSSRPTRIQEIAKEGPLITTDHHSLQDKAQERQDQVFTVTPGQGSRTTEQPSYPAEISMRPRPWALAAAMCMCVCVCVRGGAVCVCV